MANDPEFKKAFESFMDKSAKVHRDFLGCYCDDCGWHEFWWD